MLKRWKAHVDASPDVTDADDDDDAHDVDGGGGVAPGIETTDGTRGSRDGQQSNSGLASEPSGSRDETARSPPSDRRRPASTALGCLDRRRIRSKRADGRFTAGENYSRVLDSPLGATWYSKERIWPQWRWQEPVGDLLTRWAAPFVQTACPRLFGTFAHELWAPVVAYFSGPQWLVEPSLQVSMAELVFDFVGATGMFPIGRKRPCKGQLVAAHKPVMSRLMRVLSGIIGFLSRHLESPIHPGQVTSKAIDSLQAFGVRECAGIKGARPVFHSSEFVSKMLFRRMASWSDSTGQRRQRHGGAWDYELGSDDLHLAAEITHSLPIDTAPMTAGRKRADGRGLCPGELSAPTKRLRVDADRACSTTTASGESTSGGDRKRRRVARVIGRVPPPTRVDGQDARDACRQQLQDAAPTARVKFGSGRNAHRTYGVHEDAARRKAVEAYNARPLHADGWRRHVIWWPLGAPVHAQDSRYWYEYLPLDCDRCGAKGIWKRRKEFEASSCDDSSQFCDVKRR